MKFASNAFVRSSELLFDRKKQRGRRTKALSEEPSHQEQLAVSAYAAMIRCYFLRRNVVGFNPYSQRCLFSH